MKEKKLVGKIITAIFAALLTVCFFTPLLNFTSKINIYANIGGVTSSVDSEVPLVNNVTPMQIIAAQFASEEDLENAKVEFNALALRIDTTLGLTSAEKAQQKAESKEAATYYTILFSQEENLVLGSDGKYSNMISEMKLYTYCSFGLLALIISLTILLVFRCIYPKNKGFIVSGNILSIFVFILSAIYPFVTIFMTLETRMVSPGVETSMALTPTPNILFNGILIIASLLVMILTLTTKGLRKNKKI